MDFGEMVADALKIAVFAGFAAGLIVAGILYFIVRLSV